MTDWKDEEIRADVNDLLSKFLEANGFIFGLAVFKDDDGDYVWTSYAPEPGVLAGVIKSALEDYLELLAEDAEGLDE